MDSQDREWIQERLSSLMMRLGHRTTPDGHAHDGEITALMNELAGIVWDINQRIVE